MHPYSEHRADERGKATRLKHRTGYKNGGSVADKADMAKAVHEHEKHDHKGEKLTDIKLRSGGHVEGERSREHLAKRARGGGVHKKGSTHVNVIVAPQGGGMRPAGLPIAQPAMAPHPAVAPAGPRPMPMPQRPMGGPMGPPMGGIPGMRRRGGAVSMDAGAGSGEGRIEKTRAYGSGGRKPKMP